MSKIWKLGYENGDEPPSIHVFYFNETSHSILQRGQEKRVQQGIGHVHTFNRKQFNCRPSQVHYTCIGCQAATV